MSMEHSTGSNADRRPVHDARHVEEAPRLSRPVRPQEHPPPEARPHSQAPPQQTESSQLIGRRNPLTAPMISSAALSSPKSTPENDASSTSSAADTVLASPLSPTAAVGAVSVPILDEAPSKRSSLVLDDAASEKSVYYTPRNSFYFNGNGSGATLNFSAVGEKFDVAADPEEPFEMPGAWSWEDETAGERAPLAKVARELTLQRLVGGPEGAPRSMPSPAPSAVAPAVALVEAAPVLAPTAPEKSVSPPLSSAPTSREALDGSVGHIGSDDGSYETAEGFSPGQSADPVNGVPQGVTPSDGTEEVETPQVQFTELPTFHLQPPTPATVTDGVMDSPFHDLDSPPLEREFDMSQEREAYEQEGSAPVPRSPATSASSFLDDELDLDSFAPDEIAYYTPDGPVVAEAQPRPSAAAAPSRPARTTAAPADDTPKWYEPHEKSKPRSRTTSLVRRSTSGSGVDAPSTPPKSKRDRGGRVSGAYVQVINRPTTPGVVTPEKPAKTRAAAMVDNYTSSLQRSGSKRSVRSSKSTRSERSGTVSSQRTIVPDKPEKRAATPRMKSPQPPRVAATQPLQPKPRRAPASASSSRPMSPIVAPPAQPEYGAPRGLSYTPDEPQLLSPPESLGRSSLSSESRRPSLRHNDWHDVQQAAPRPGSGNSSEVSGPSLASGPGPLNRAVIGQGGWAAAAAEPIKMFVPTDGDGWAAFQPLPPRSRATPLPGSRNSSFDLGGRSSSSAASSSLAQSASGSVAGAPQGSQVISPPLSAVGNMTSPTSSVSGRPPKSRLRTMYHASEHYESDEGEIPSRSYASPPPDHPGSTEQQRTACADDRGPPTVHVGGKDHAEHYDYASEHSNSQTSPAKTNGRWPADAFYDRSERGKAPSRPPSSRSSQYSAPSMYSAASAPPGRLNSPLPPLPADASPYEAAARAHAARLGLASSLNPNVLTVLPEMSIQDSNELYLPQRRNSHRFGSSASELGARGNMSPKRSASMFNVKRYSCAASDIGHGPREYASSEFARPGFADDIERRHSFDPRRGSVDSRSEARAPSRSQSFRAPSRTGDYNPGDVVAPSHGTGVISLDSPSVRPLNNYPLMESNGYDQTQQNGYTNMVLPKGGSFKPSDPMKAKGPDLQLLGVPPTSMAAITLSSALHTYHLKHESPTPAHLRWTLPPPVDFSTVAPPQHVSNTQILIQVYAVAVDWLDIAALDEKHKHDVGRWIPGRSFVGRCITTGVDEKEIARGDVVIGLLDIRHSGALAEYIVVGRRRVARVNPDTHLELEELAALPAQGIAVHRAIRDVGVSRGQQALVMDAHEGLPALFCQELTRMGLVVTAIVPGGREGAQAAALAYGARGVLAGSPTSVMHGLPESLFALVIDTAGAADAARRILCDRGHVLSLRSGDGPTPKHSLKSKLGLARKKNLSTAYVQPAGAGDAPVDASGLDYRDVLEEPVLGVLHPVVNEVVPFEQGASVFASRRNMDRLRVAVVRIVN
ncbi:hypothetical protein CC85DRAFT_293189 [Cutaneotrichosporon oleaginosum]|uniref:Enoyl reductase (ER) domain-containing protein n=1 Tax=Cutaneotrichosporon oleaginosum TaxID=879819 RepID=A0A0J0XHE0_9TREE|nr:uncharacterized protein CC85DRAFT_293189 [Cutaneotrichosporon oleaginosum]KLT40545.1 hypothetical protein CC85DRAFT_293189 [Cutaneotrichosporon oleaginosum]TXT08384.1 hypothetical protein COLE_05308 [Cutaneotrichosporon oleaginosum]